MQDFMGEKDENTVSDLVIFLRKVQRNRHQIYILKQSSKADIDRSL